MSIHPSCYRSQEKRDRTPTIEWFRRAWAKAYTQDEVIKMIRELPPDKYLDGMIRVYPSPKEVKVDQSSTFQLVISGLQTKVVEGKVIDNKELAEHLNDNEEETTK